MTKTAVVVVGSGAGGLMAALAAHEHGADVRVIEHAEKVGGTSAWSNGMVWIPWHDRSPGLTREEALTYVDAFSHRPRTATTEAFVDGGGAMLDFFAATTGSELRPIDRYADYQPELPGGRPDGGRTLEADLIAVGELAEWADRITIGHQTRIRLQTRETPLGHGHAPAAEELERRDRLDVRGGGQALVAHLLRSCLARGIAIETGARAVDLVVVDGVVRGVVVEREGTTAEYAGSVVLASGGFEWNETLTRGFLRGPMTRPVSVPTNRGDGLVMALRAGARVGLMSEAWWVPTADVEIGDGRTVPWMVNADRTRPGSIMVNATGRRFVNESTNYHVMGAALHELDVRGWRYANLPAWLVVDAGFVARYGLATYQGGEVPAWVRSSDSLAGLATVIGVPPQELEHTVAEWNEHVADGHDPDFGRGESAFDRWQGDPDPEIPHPNLGPLATPPYYAVEMHSGALGTKGGLSTDESGRVLTMGGEVLPGLYAVGNVAESVSGLGYGGAGGTLGPALVFGMLAGRHAASRTIAR